MEIIPAIDLKGGRCVRLYQGDFAKETVFSADPVAMALYWKSLGARRLHVVDLDGARQGKPQHLNLVGEIVSQARLPLQMGGGLRDLETICQVLGMGVERVVLGTVAVENPGLVEEACRRFGEAIVVSLDARRGYLAIQGWKQSTTLRVQEVLKRMAGLGVKRFIYTDIARDGTLTLPNFSFLGRLMQGISLPLLVAGGISSLEHLKRLARLGVEGVILGRAIYTGAIDLGQALQALC